MLLLIFGLLVSRKDHCYVRCPCKNRALVFSFPFYNIGRQLGDWTELRAQVISKLKA